MSPGPMFDPEGKRGDYWRFARAMFAAGFRRGELVHNTFAYHFTPAGFMADGRSGARVSRFSRRHRPNRNAGQRHSAAQAALLCGNALISAHHPREGR